jgi:hypothetical protein
MTTTLESQHADVPPPPGATVGDWESVDWGVPDIRHARPFKCTPRASATSLCGDPVTVEVSGHQAADGDINAVISVGGDIPLDAANARGLAADLLAAADEVDRLERAELGA